MHVIVNLLPIVAGGGLQNALSFIKAFSAVNEKNDYVFLVRCNSEIEKLCDQNGLQVIRVGNNDRARLKFEFLSRNIFQKGQVCFTLFGPVMLGASGYLNNIVGCAYSNLFYPKLSFWSYLPIHRRIKKELIDLYRRRQLAKGDYWIFETEVLKRRAIEICCFPEDRVSVVPMAASSLVSRGNINLQALNEYSRLCPGRFKFLFLSGAHPNKRLHLLPAIGMQMRRMGFDSFAFITTFEEDTHYAKFVISEIEKHGLSGHFKNIGKVAATEVSTLIASINCICTFSLLESFSNNFVEAWKMEVPLVVTDGDWSKDSCGEGAIYVQPDDPGKCAQSLISICENRTLVDKQIAMGINQLAKYPSPERKLRLYLDVIAKAAKMGPLPGKVKKITWG